MSGTYFVAVVGTRSWTDLDMIRSHLDKLRAKHPTMGIVSGAGGNVDNFAAAYAREHGLTLIEHPADWSRGKRAGPERNRLIVEDADLLVAFWSGESRGTKSSLDLAYAKGIPSWVVEPSGEHWRYSPEGLLKRFT